MLENGYPSGAYYLAGYAAECAIKACIAKQTQRHDFPDKGRAIASYDHDIGKLLKTAGLDQAARDVRQPDLAIHWKLVREWSVNSRYRVTTEAQAAALIRALEHRRYGVLRWLKLHW